MEKQKLDQVKDKEQNVHVNSQISHGFPTQMQKHIRENKDNSNLRIYVIREEVGQRNGPETGLRVRFQKEDDLSSMIRRAIVFDNWSMENELLL